MDGQMTFDGFRDIQASTDWKWCYADYPKEKNGLKVFSCFSCGGGSTMGYKLAGCDVIGNCEIDEKMNDVYVANHNPKYNFCMDIRKFNKLNDLPDELYNLDILDGSPPCTTFSIAGDREETWGKKKKFREGQAEQTLDDLSFVFIETVNKLKPKCVIMENVEGIMLGEAWSYVQQIYKDFNDAGYDVKHYLLKAENMGVPQARHRVFFIAFRKDLNFDYDKLDLFFDYEKVLFKQAKSNDYQKPSNITAELIKNAIPNKDTSLADVIIRQGGKRARFNEKIVWDESIAPTIHAHGLYRGNDISKFTRLDYIHCQSFPEDYKESRQNIAYICGMSVPPLMIKRIVGRILATGVLGG